MEPRTEVSDQPDSTGKAVGLQISTCGPRRVRKTFKAFAIQCSLSTAFVSVLFGGAYFTNKETARLQNLAQRGVLENAQVTWKFEEDAHNRKECYLSYTYQSNGHTLGFERQVSYATYESVKVGDTIPITFSPSNPDDYELDVVDASRISAVRSRLIFETLLLGIFVQAVQLYFRLRSLKEAAILRSYLALRATIDAKGKVETYPHNSCRSFSFQFRMPNGDLRGFTDSFNVSSTQGWEVGDELLVMADPNDKDRPYCFHRLTLAKVVL